MSDTPQECPQCGESTVCGHDFHWEPRIRKCEEDITIKILDLILEYDSYISDSIAKDLGYEREYPIRHYRKRP